MSDRVVRSGQQLRNQQNRGRPSPTPYGDRNSSDRIDSSRNHSNDDTDDDDDTPAPQQQRNFPPNRNFPPLAQDRQFPASRRNNNMMRHRHPSRIHDSPRPLMPNMPRQIAYRPPSSQPSSVILATDSKERVERILADIIAQCVSEDDFISVNMIVDKLFKLYQVTRWSEFDITNVRNPYEDLKPLKNFTKRHGKLYLLIDVFKQIRVIGTLDELKEEILNQFEIDSYDRLNVGPISKHPDIIRLFNLQNISTIRPTKSIEIIDLFHNYTRSLKYGEKADFDAFKKHAADHFDVPTWDHLGIYVTSFPYILQTCRAIKKGSNAQNSTWTKRIQEVEIELCEEQLEKVKTRFQNAFSDHNCQTYINMTPIDVFHRLVEIIDERTEFEKINQEQGLQMALDTLRCSDVHRYFMNLAIFLGTIKEPTEIPINNDSKQCIEQTPSSPMIMVNTNNTAQQQQQPPMKVSLNKLCMSLYKLIDQSDGIFKLSTLLEIQRNLCQKNDFTIFGHGDFIKFLCDNQRTIENKLEFDLFNVDSCGGIKRTELFAFIQHLFHNNIHDRKSIEKTIKYHFNLQNLRQIGFHNIEKLCDRVEKQKQIQNTIPTIQYEEVLLGDEYINKLDTNISRPYVPDDDHLCKYLTNCPIFVDINSWSHWNRLHMQEKGHIKEFLHRNKSKLTNILWLEVSNNNTQFIRLSHSSIEDFEKDLMHMKLREAAAHLLSLSIQERDSTRLPLARLQTIMKAWFIKLKQLDVNNNSSGYAIEQIVNFLHILPFPFSSSILQKLILEPAEPLFPNYKIAMWKLAQNNLSIKLHFEQLGLTFGIEEWTRDLYNEVTNLSENIYDRISNETITVMDKYPQQNTTQINEPIKTSYKSVDISKQEKSTLSSRPVQDNKADNNDIDPIDHIEGIRKILGKNANLNDETQKVVGNLQDLLGECLKKISDDLYSDQGHFVLELIQNADDNDYSELNANSIPNLKFTINDEQIEIYNNENGFQIEHINAICTVGKSTKGKHKEGVSGHKGIGFKSVFVVSNRPEIHSNNYHICFDASNGDRVGYVCPIWLNDDEYKSVVMNDENNIWNTCIRLKLKSDTEIQQQIKQKFDNVNPKLLLFLRRLKSLEIHFENHYIKKFTRYDHPKNIIELTEYNGEDQQTNYWLVIKKSVNVPETIQQKLREIKSDVVATTIAIGFPLQHMEQCLSRNTPVPIQHLFAYLPVRQFGFRFILQADFEVPASRQDILTGNEWNEWIRNEMIQLLPDAYDYFTELPTTLQNISSSPYFQTINPIHALKYFLKFIPNINEVDPYFHGFIEHCLTKLREKIKFPVRQDHCEQQVEWQPASKCVMIRDAFILKILSSNLLSVHCGKYFLHEYFDDVDEKILSLLGIEKLNIHEIIRIIKKQFLNQQQSANSQIRGTAWEHYEEGFRKDYKNISEYKINDFVCNEFKEIFHDGEKHCSEHPSLYHDTCYQLLAYINKKWEKIRHYFRVGIFLADNPYRLEEVDSTFCIDLKRFNWISATCIEYIYNEQTKEITKNSTTKLKQPMNVFIRRTQSYADIFIHYFPYIESIHLHSELIFTLNINDGITPQDVILRLLEYINSSTYTSLSNIDISNMDENAKRERINILLDNPPKQPYRRKFIETPLIMIIWDDPTHLLPEHYLMKYFYKELERLFIDILRIPLTPNFNSYLELLKNYSQKEITDEITNNIWKIFENLKDEDNNTIIDFFQQQSLIPSMTRFGWIKMNDKPFIPDDKNVAQLFESEYLPIIKLPEYDLTTNGRKFLDQFQLKNFSEVLKSTVDVTNIKTSDTLKQFYEKTLPFVSKFLFTETDMFDESYNKRKLNEIFSQMKFFTVDNIKVTFNYKDISFDHLYQCYLDEKLKKFYLLNSQHYSQSIDTMIQFIIHDTIKECQYKRDKLDKYYRKLLTAYSKNQLLTNIVNDDEFKLMWKINENNEEIDENKIEEEEEDTDDSDTDCKRPVVRTLAAEIYDEEEIKIPKSKVKQKSSNSQINNNNNLQENTNKQTTDVNLKDNNRSTTIRREEHQRSDFASNFKPKKQNIAKFEHIDLSHLKIPDEDDMIQKNDEEIDEEYLRQVGRKGEELVFKHLENLYRSNDKVLIEWLNKTGETGLPYDIEINFSDKSQDTHRIEVKTTSKRNDNYQFSISIQEVEEILKYPNTYYIYRVNLINHSLTILKDIKLNLSDKRQLDLKMNVLINNDLN
ncbi:hypothetical protein I4U23_016121 [Adineta vaga]|nr:hypothetical protein I4U23_016121 [Adineta vaga]